MKSALFILFLIFTENSFSYKELVIHSPLQKKTSFICTKGIKAGPGKSHNSRNSKYAIDLSYRDSQKKRVKSIFDGIVVSHSACHKNSPPTCGHGFGNFVKVLSSKGYIAFYSHLKIVNVKSGDKVKVGDTLGAIGQTGYASAPHLHFSIHYSWKEEGLSAHKKTPVLLPESIPFKLNICSSNDCKRRKILPVKNLQCRTKNLTKYFF